MRIGDRKNLDRDPGYTSRIRNTAKHIWYWELRCIYRNLSCIFICVGVYSNSFSMLATQMNHLIHEKKLEPFTIIKMKKHICNSVKYTFLLLPRQNPELNVRLFFYRCPVFRYLVTYFLGAGTGYVLMNRLIRLRGLQWNNSFESFPALHIVGQECNFSTFASNVEVVWYRCVIIGKLRILYIYL